MIFYFKEIFFTFKLFFKYQCDCDLPPQKCPGPNEEYTACGYGCGVTCAQVNKGLVRCPETCGRGCFCTKGNKIILKI
jgi:hypothetical protein